MQQTIRYAVIGLGHIAQVAVLPAFKKSKNSKLVALITDDSAKLHKLGRKYKVKNLFSYKQFDQCMKSGLIDAIYITLPNSLHREYVERAASFGIHVLCEKPMALTEADCLSMIENAEKNNVKLMIAYRLHFEKANLKAIDIAKSGKLGDLRIFNSTFTMQVKDKKNIRLQKKLGGGTLFDIGIYCLNASRYLFREEPVEVFATNVKNTDTRFKDVDEMTSVILKYPNDKLASFTCSFGAAAVGFYELIGTKGSLRVDNAYEYLSKKTHNLTIGQRTKRQNFAKRDQFAPELINFSKCILENRNPQPSGFEGLMDVRIVNALLESIEKKKFITIEGIEYKISRPSEKQEIHVKPHAEPEVFNATKPHG